MWLFTSKGFLSVVNHREDSEVFIVRARQYNHLAEYVSTKHIWEDPNADYRYRALITYDELVALMMAAVNDLTYDNFKNSIPAHDHRYKAAASRVWSEMLPLQNINLDCSPEMDDQIDWDHYGREDGLGGGYDNGFWGRGA